MTSAQHRFSVLVEKDVYMPMRDGVKLAADIYRPGQGRAPAKGRFPAVLVRTAFDKSHVQSNIDCRFFASRGYVVMVQDVRGRPKSEGSFYHGRTEASDGYDTIEWLAKQPYCDGRIGMTGISYLAAVQSAAAIANPPHLKSLFHVEAPSNYFFACFREGGAFLQNMVPIMFFYAETSKQAAADPLVAAALRNQNVSDWLTRLPLRKGTSPLKLVPENEQWLLDIMSHTEYDQFWKSVETWAVEEYLGRHADIPCYFVGGWYDMFTKGETTLYQEMRKRKKSPPRLLLGPWLHGKWTSFSGDVDFGAEAALSPRKYNELQMHWFDQTLRGVRDKGSAEPPVRIFVMGGGDGRKNRAGRMRHGGKWRSEWEWPLARTTYVPHYFGADGSLSLKKPTTREGSTSYTFDPRDPVPTIGGTSYFRQLVSSTGAKREFKDLVPVGAHDQRERPDSFGCKTTLPLESRHDVLAFATQPLREAVEVTGPSTVKLWASSSAVDTDFTAKLVDVHPSSIDYPEGYAMNLCDTILRARYRKSFEKPEFMKPGEIYEFMISLPPISNLFTEGHQVRLDISSSNFPTFDVNPNTGEPPGGKVMTADNRIYHDTLHPSHIILPIIPNH